ncbi:hypothetical protein WR25_03217 [Diploscapter pachys]|uniref:Uncharacterized protein n=1 Tax=Diploscapter pachys TaxID=2018661 RepID=A0A2A2K826_9BILA|nr:hypothetical protein WR25_03217 [Diploscapter pachys]
MTKVGTAYKQKGQGSCSPPCPFRKPDRSGSALGRILVALGVRLRGGFGSLGLGDLGLERLVLGGRDGRRHDRRDREVAVFDRRRRALGQLDVADVDRIADLAALQRNRDLAGDVGGVDDQLDLVAGDVEHAALLQAAALVLVREHDRHRDGDGGVLTDAQEVDMDRTVGDRVERHVLRQRALTADHDDRVHEAPGLTSTVRGTVRPMRPPGEGRGASAPKGPSLASCACTESGPARCPAPTAMNTVPGLVIRCLIHCAQLRLRSTSSTFATSGELFSSSFISRASASGSPRAHSSTIDAICLSSVGNSSTVLSRNWSCAFSDRLPKKPSCCCGVSSPDSGLCACFAASVITSSGPLALSYPSFDSGATDSCVAASHGLNRSSALAGSPRSVTALVKAARLSAGRRCVSGGVPAGATPVACTSPCIVAGSGITISSFTSSALSNALLTASSNQVRPGFNTWIVPNR